MSALTGDNYMKRTLAIALGLTLAVALTTPSFAKGGGVGRTSYSGSSHSSSHGGTYKGSSGGSSHKGGTYSAPNGGSQYGTHK